MKRAVLYARVSTKRQATEGFSLDQQIERLREHAAEHGYEVVGEYLDPGHSGAKLERPGMDLVRDRVQSGGIDLVLAQDRDRFARMPELVYLLKYEFAKHGCKLRALNDRGDGSPVDELTDGIIDQIAKYERANTIDRTKRNKRKKARTGMVVGGHVRAFGFDWKRNEDGRTVGYEVNEAEMRVVRRIFEDVARGVGIRTVKEKLDAEHVPTPNPRSASWNRQFIRDMLRSDLYLSHTVDELRQLGVADEVVADLDADGLFGVYRYQGIPVPVPDAGIPLQVVLGARRRIENNEPTERRHGPSTNAGRFWELSGGILFCSECGRRMQPHTVKKPREGTKPNFYYRCQSTTSGKADRCSMKKHINADKIEREVWKTVRGVMDDKPYVLGKLEEHFAQKRGDLSRLGADAASLIKRLHRIEERWTKVKLAYEADALTIADLKARRTELDAERRKIERELKRATNRKAELEKLDADEAETRERIEAGYGGLDDATPEKRRQVYADLNLRVDVGRDQTPYISGWFPIRHGISIYREGADPRCLFSEERPPCHLNNKESVGRQVTSSARGAR